jgi:uncharacterized membrane protein
LSFLLLVYWTWLVLILMFFLLSTHFHQLLSTNPSEWFGLSYHINTSTYMYYQQNIGLSFLLLVYWTWLILILMFFLLFSAVNCTFINYYLQTQVNDLDETFMPLQVLICNINTIILWVSYYSYIGLDTFWSWPFSIDFSIVS